MGNAKGYMGNPTGRRSSAEFSQRAKVNVRVHTILHISSLGAAIRAAGRGCVIERVLTR